MTETTRIVAGECLLPIQDVSKRIGLGKSKIYEMVGEETFPRPVRLSPKAVRWKQSEIDAWIAALPTT